MNARKILSSIDNLMQESLDAARTATASMTALWWPRTKADVKGNACHCRPGLGLHLVHSEGLREGADVVVDFGSNVGSRRRQVPVSALARIAGKIAPGDVVHVKAELLGQFLEYVFPSVGAPIVLVTGDSDFSPVRTYAHLLDEPRIIHWFAQNCDVPYRHPRLTRIPIGIDNPIFTKMEKRIGFLVEMTLGKGPFDLSFSRNDMGDQSRMQQIAAHTAVDNRDKPAKALCTFHMNQKLISNFAEMPDRLEAYEILRDSADCQFVPRRLAQDDCWRIHDSFGFELSPRGKGLDCFRTWEALFLKTIPIVKTTTLDPLYVDENFPVVIVPSYRDVTTANLARWKAQLQDGFTPNMLRRLTNDYWLGKIRAAGAAYRVD